MILISSLSPRYSYHFRPGRFAKRERKSWLSRATARPPGSITESDTDDEDQVQYDTIADQYSQLVHEVRCMADCGVTSGAALDIQSPVIASTSSAAERFILYHAMDHEEDGGLEISKIAQDNRIERHALPAFTGEEVAGHNLAALQAEHHEVARLG